MATAAKSLPAHVPPELAVTLPLFARKVVKDCPQETLIPEMHRTLGPISYVTNIFPGDQPGWLLTGYDDVMAMLRNADDFTKNGMGKWSQGIGESWLVIPTEADPPVHTAYRKALNPSFAPQKMAAMKDQLRERATNLIDKFKDLTPIAVGYLQHLIAPPNVTRPASYERCQVSTAPERRRIVAV